MKNAVNYILIGMISVLLYEKFIQYNIWLLVVGVFILLMLFLIKDVIKLLLTGTLLVVLFYFNIITIEMVNNLEYKLLGNYASTFTININNLKEDAKELLGMIGK